MTFHSDTRDFLPDFSAPLANSLATPVPLQECLTAEFQVAIKLIEYGPGCLRSSRRPVGSRVLRLTPQAILPHHHRRPAFFSTNGALAAIILLASVLAYTYTLLATPPSWVNPENANQPILPSAPPALFRFTAMTNVESSL